MRKLFTIDNMIKLLKRIQENRHDVKQIKMIKKSEQKEKFKYYIQKERRIPLEELLQILTDYDVISFDIFDTAVFRKVEFPNDVFTIMASEIGHCDFLNIRKAAENKARELADIETFSREVTLFQIYDVLEKDYGIEKKWAQREVELETELIEGDPYILELYNQLKMRGKTLIFCSDMYLPRDALEKILEKNGYSGYKKFYLSNEYRLRKGDGTLQKKILEDFSGKKIVHLGDHFDNDYKKSIEAGINAVFVPRLNLAEREGDMENLAGSFYRAIVNTKIGNVIWNKNIYYEHGFRVGGILTAGFCGFISKISKEKHIDKILFCARDCYSVWKIYNEFYKEFENEYIPISRYALFGIASERYLYELFERFIWRHANECGNNKTIGTVLAEAGFDYLVDYLEDDDINQFLFPCNIDKKILEKFIFNHAKIIEEHLASSKKAAVKYFDNVLADSQNVLVVDICWSGTCVTGLKYFINENLKERQIKIHGALMCTSRGDALRSGISDGTIQPYIYSPLNNTEFARFMFPVRTSEKKKDLLHMPLEYLYTSTESTLVDYKENDDGTVGFEYADYECDNKDEILSMQEGMRDFVELFKKRTANYEKFFTISPAVAFNPLKKAIEHQDYCYAIYKNFNYDAFTARKESKSIKYGELFDARYQKLEEKSQTKSSEKKKILCITPELIYAGAPRSLLRICKVIFSLGYEPIVWSAKMGPFIKEYEQNNIQVKVVTEKDLNHRNTINLLKDFEMAICNTIVTDKYARVLSYHLPVVWYIREATNIMDFCNNNPERLYTLKHSRDLCCVSEYAATALKKYTRNKIKVVKNSVEDERDMATDYVSGSGEKVKFVQFGTMELRKGYDALLAAYKAMPKEYREKSELYFAGGFIQSASSYCAYIFSEIEKENNVHYLGIVEGEKNKIETLSKMDVVVVASRDESCSLVALEGAMLSKPLIVTENVGAKYMVGGDNGFVVKTADVQSLKDAMMKMIDDKKNLKKMGERSFEYYKRFASMESYTADIKNLIEEKIKENRTPKKLRFFRSMIIHSSKRRKLSLKFGNLFKTRLHENVIVSLTSHPARIGTVHICIESLLNQRTKPKKILLYLSKEQFPLLEEDLPKELLRLSKRNSRFKIRWTDDDLKPHKKYFYAMQEYPNLPIIIVDDDVVYDKRLVGKLMNSYRRFPDSINCMRTNLITFKNDGNLRAYKHWPLGYRKLTDTPSYQLLPVGVGGVLYPPKALPPLAFNKNAIQENCLFNDDLWLKMWMVYSERKTVIPKDCIEGTAIPNTQESALWRINNDRNGNDFAINNILKFFDENICDSKILLERIRKDGFC